MEPIRLGINNETIDSVNSFALTLYKILQFITEHESAFNLVNLLIIFIFIYFFAKLVFGFFSEKRLDKSIDRNNELLDKVIQSLATFNENIKTFKK